MYFLSMFLFSLDSLKVNLLSLLPYQYINLASKLSQLKQSNSKLKPSIFNRKITELSNDVYIIFETYRFSAKYREHCITCSVIFHLISKFVAVSCGNIFLFVIRLSLHYEKLWKLLLKSRLCDECWLPSIRWSLHHKERSHAHLIPPPLIFL